MMIEVLLREVFSKFGLKPIWLICKYPTRKHTTLEVENVDSSFKTSLETVLDPNNDSMLVLAFRKKETCL